MGRKMKLKEKKETRSFSIEPKAYESFVFGNSQFNESAAASIQNFIYAFNAAYDPEKSIGKVYEDIGELLKKHGNKVPYIRGEKKDARTLDSTHR